MVKYDSKTLRVDADFFLNTEEKISVFENTRLGVDEALVNGSVRVPCNQNSFSGDYKISDG